MTPRRLRLLEIATAWPLVYMLIFLAFWLVWMVGIVGAGTLAPRLDPIVVQGAFSGGMALFAAVMVLHVFTMVESLVVMAVHAYLAIAENSDRNQGLLWALVCFFGGPIGQLLHIAFVLRPATRGELASA
ncbi:MAG: hypothetical protein EP330_28695 [Deltaproteobacteria bacterium]|nr:MAG: hypothetical protein EP330_28695 [Deltaproteobacteria bacterium]